MSQPRRSKKKFKDTKVGQFLVGRSGVVQALGDSIPDKGLLGLVKNLITDDKVMSQTDKETALKMLEMDEQELEAVTRRWEADAQSDVKLAKLVRPLIILYLTLAMTIYIILDSSGILTIKEQWGSLLETILVATYVSYFGGRSVEKYAKIKKN